MKEPKVILAIDDHDSLLRLVRSNLELAGYEVITTNSGAAGLELIKEKKPALVLLDTMMPEMDGIETLRRIREFTDIPVIMLTAVDDPESLDKAIQTGADDYITKPFSVHMLMARVQAKLRRFGKSKRNY